MFISASHVSFICEVVVVVVVVWVIQRKIKYTLETPFSNLFISIWQYCIPYVLQEKVSVVNIYIKKKESEVCLALQICSPHCFNYIFTIVVTVTGKIVFEL